MSGRISRVLEISVSRIPLLAALLTVSFAGCLGTGGRGDRPLDPRESAGEEIELLVRNHNFSQATIYLAPEFGSKRVGIVNGKSDTTFRFEWHLPHIQLRVKHLAGADFLTDRLTVSPDDALELLLPASRQ